LAESAWTYLSIVNVGGTQILLNVIKDKIAWNDQVWAMLQDRNQRQAESSD